MRILVAPASLKGVLSGREAASALATGVRSRGGEAVEMPVADGGEGTLEILHGSLGGEWHRVDVHDAFGIIRQAFWLALPNGIAAVEAAQAIPLDPSRLDPIAASSRGLGELISAAGRPAELLVCLGGTATVDGGAGLREVLRDLPAPTRVACDVNAPLLDAARMFAAQKGATGDQVRELEVHCPRQGAGHRSRQVPQGARSMRRVRWSRRIFASSSGDVFAERSPRARSGGSLRAWCPTRH